MKQLISHCIGCQALSQTLRSSLGPGALGRLDAFRSRRKLAKGQFLFHDGERPSGAYCISTGSLKLFKTDQDGKEHILGLALRGTLLGVRAITTREPYSISAQAREDTTYCFFESEKFSEFLDKSPEIGRAVLSQMGRQLRLAREELLERSAATASQRLAHCLGQLAVLYAPFGGRIRVSGQELAAMIGVAPETISRLLRKFSEGGLLANKGREIHVLNAAGLAQTAGDEGSARSWDGSKDQDALTFA